MRSFSIFGLGVTLLYEGKFGIADHYGDSAYSRHNTSNNYDSHMQNLSMYNKDNDHWRGSSGDKIAHQHGSGRQAINSRFHAHNESDINLSRIGTNYGEEYGSAAFATAPHSRASSVIYAPDIDIYLEDDSSSSNDSSDLSEDYKYQLAPHYFDKGVSNEFPDLPDGAAMWVGEDWEDNSYGEDCDMVPYAKLCKCTKPTVRQEGFECPKTESREECETQEILIPDQCMRPIVRDEGYSCVKTEYREECIEIPVSFDKICMTNKTIQRPYSCPRTDYKERCHRVEKIVPDTCVRSINREENYNCTKRELQKICQRIPQTVEESCTKTRNEMQSYECSRTEEKQLCSPYDKTVPKMCEKTLYRSEEYDCSHTMYTKQCHDEPNEVSDTCYRAVEKEVSTPCIEPPKCSPLLPIQNLQSHNNVCEYDEIVDEEYDCGNEVELYDCGGHDSCIDDRECLLVEGMSLNKHKKHSNCKIIKHKTPKKCLRSKKIRDQAPCSTLDSTRTHRWNDRCSHLAKHSLCYKTELVKEPYKCSKTILKKICEDAPYLVPETCSRQIPYQESYDCSYQIQEEQCHMTSINIPDTCQREIQVEYPSMCPTTKYITKCFPKYFPVQSTCTKELPDTETYPCEKTVYDEVCEQVPCEKQGTCYEDEIIQVPYPCPETQYKQECKNMPITVPDTCYTTVKDVESYQCDKTVLQQICGEQIVSSTGTCYRQINDVEEYDCFETAFREECKPKPIAPPCNDFKSCFHQYKCQREGGHLDHKTKCIKNDKSFSHKKYSHQHQRPKKHRKSCKSGKCKSKKNKSKKYNHDRTKY